MKKFNLTDKELIIAKILVQEGLDCMGGKRPIAFENDCYSWAHPDTLVDKGYSKHEAAGFFSSLAEKGFLEDAGDPNEKDGFHWCVAEDGWRWLDTIWNGGVK